jgi:predicted enzyme related to lactoylglutathione lyase
MSAVKLNLLVLKTHHPERVRDFYAALGLRFTEEKHGGGPTHFATRVGDTVLELYPLPAGAGPADTSTRLGFAVADLDAAVRSLDTAIVSQPRETPWGGRAVARDPDGRAVELVQG